MGEERETKEEERDGGEERDMEKESKTTSNHSALAPKRMAKECVRVPLCVSGVRARMC